VCVCIYINLTLQSRVLLEKLLVAHSVKKLSALYEIRWFITVHTKACQLSLILSHFNPVHTLFLQDTTVYAFIFQVLSSVGFLTNILHTFIINPLTRLAHLTPVYIITVVLGEE